MDRWNTVDDLLDFAINGEQQAVNFYTRLADQATNPAMRTAFTEFAAEEAGHKAKLLDVKAGKTLEPASHAVQDLKIADYTVTVAPEEAQTYQQALLLAMKREKAAYRLYRDLAATTDDAGLRAMLEALAQEEAHHKVRFEIEYDDSMTDN